MKKIALVTCFIMIALHLHAQQLERNKAEQQNIWFPVNLIFRVNDKWGFHLEEQLRNHGPFTEIQQILLRGGVDHYFNSSFSVTAGYGHVFTYPYGEQPIAREFHEHRVWQQALIKHEYERIAVSHRYRLEQRWLQKQQADLRDEHLYVNRLRYRAGLNIRVNHKAAEQRTIFIALANEAFVNFGKNVNYNILDQNRAYAGIGCHLTRNIETQAGYLNHLVFKGNGIDYENNHTYQLSITWRLDFRNREESSAHI